MKFSQVVLTLACLAAIGLLNQGSASAQFTAPIDSSYYNPDYRDSVNHYAFEQTVYNQERLTYDFGYSLALLPVAGEAYVSQTIRGIVLSATRLVALGAAGYGTYRYIEGDQSKATSLIVAGAGLATYALLKLFEIRDVLHSVSRINEDLAIKYHIADEDLAPGSIRYPLRRSWPSWVTEAPPAREEPLNARAILNEPRPAGMPLLQFQMSF